MPEVILPCPFCGMKYNEKAVMLVLEPCDTDGYFVQCLDCGACGPVGYPEEYDHYDSDAVQKAEEEAKAKALDLWANIKPRALTWTHEPPKVAGWYWRKETAKDRAHVFHFTGNWEDYGEHWESDRVCQLPLNLNGNLWAGPISPPID